MSRALNLLKTAARLGGLEVRRSSPNSREDLRLPLFLALHEIDWVIDIGANYGQFSEALLSEGYTGEILSVEPQPDVCELLKQRAATIGERWHVATAQALTDHVGSISFNISQSKATSSILQSDTEVAKRVSQIRPVSRITVPANRLDDLLKHHSIDASKSFLKLDVQGAEKQVLAGGPDTLAKAKGIMIELSTIAFYSGQALFPELIDLLEQAGFQLWDIIPGFRNSTTYRLEQFDAVFFRN